MKTSTKISIKSVIGNVKKVIKDNLPKDATVLPLMRIIGVVQSFTEGESDYGKWLRLDGQFKATNLITGDKTASGKCFLPDAITVLVIGCIKDNEGEALEMAFDIVVKTDDSSSTGYIYECESLMEVAESEAMKRLEKTLPKIALTHQPEITDITDKRPSKNSNK